MLTRMFKNQKGFTLVELLAVIVILGIILAIAVPAIGNVIDDSEKKAHIANVQLVENAAELAYVSGLPEAVDEDGITIGELVSKGFLNELPESVNETLIYKNEHVITINNNGVASYSEYSNP